MKITRNGMNIPLSGPISAMLVFAERLLFNKNITVARVTHNRG